MFCGFQLLILSVLTFCSAKGRHFHCGDFEAMGRHFCEVLMDYTRARPKGCRYEKYEKSSLARFLNRQSTIVAWLLRSVSR